MKKILYLFAFLYSCGILAQEEAMFAKANELYNQEKYQEAIATYKGILEGGKESTAVYYNLGNAHYKLSNIGPSIFYYEKALQLSPNDADVKNNLAFAKNATIDVIDVIPEGFISKTVRGITTLFSYDGWAWLSVITMLLFVVLFILYRSAQISMRKRIFFLSSALMLVFSVLSIAFAFQQDSYLQNNQYGIVFAQETSVKSEPNLKSEEVFELHEGTKVKVSETINNWKKIKLSDGKIGWIPAADIKEL